MAQSKTIPHHDRNLFRNLQFTLEQAHRRTDRFMRLYHRTKEEAIRPQWLARAAQNDQLAAETAKKLRDMLSSLS